MPDIRKQLLAVFEVEYRDHVDAIRAALAQARDGTGMNVREIFRRAHSLKGAARAVDLPAVEEAAHAMEALLADVMEQDGRIDAALTRQVEPYLAAIERHAGAAYGQPGEAAASDAGAGESAPEILRIDAARLQQLSAVAHDLSGALDRLDADAHDLRALQVRADALARLLEAPDSGEDRTRLAQEARTISRGLRTAMRMHTETSQLSLAAGARLREEIERMALVPASTVFAGLETMLQDLADEAGKRIDVQIDGLETRADRRLLQGLRDPVIHLLRNAVVHGIESPLDRHSIGKPERGRVELSIVARTGRLELTVRDDGRGPNLQRIEEIAVRKGLMPPRTEREAAPSVERLLSLVFEPGFSTASEVDRIAGRGMGLSVVAEAARRAGGGAHMRAAVPYGAEVVISTPLSASRQPVLLFNQGDQLYGLPTRVVERVVRVAPAALELLNGNRVIKLEIDGNQIAIPVVSLDLVTGVAAMAGTDADQASIAIVRLGGQRLGLHVHALREVRETTVTALTGSDLDDLVQGAVQLEHDDVAIVVNPEALLRRYARSELGDVRAPVRPVAAKMQRTILVVDDSVTTRTLEKSILEANGFRVVLAVDGVDALERLRTMDVRVDLIVADIEMPRMDGLQLLSAIKADNRLAKTPVIMMTSRASQEDIRRGMELGADAYLVKQTFDQRELLETIGQLV